ncbi:hypothetical protein BC477_02520 [Clavibacter michiganensis subsp. michiganensis]|uniref:HNH endonuclease n=1 Tax=Clavibacter michiganensis subsp. michiganensis TaxID=33013 RepID=A0A251XJ63_CLAMM|nr:HNH endonuclease signature motif containing protein [Clavibacter michiganensis]OUD86841.1 hypothetical protein BC477_02520 [Clavibacter michiganensis subsp. michiganensis]OUE03584.1 hypothetical protein CMMCAS07_01455 [Clavibacter michiganensis subsp. michiganensis]
MSITDRTRKLLWTRAHNRCAMCRAALTEVDHEGETVLGEEAHIIARSPLGPRGADGDRTDVDGYANLILLCSMDHKRVDSQRSRYSAEWLRAKKAEHEKWADDRLRFQPIRLQKGDDEDAVPLMPMITGEDVWHVINGAGFFQMRPLQGHGDPSASDAADEFLQTAREYGELAGVIEDAGFKDVRAAQRQLQDGITGLWELHLFVFGRRLTRTLTGGEAPPMPVAVASIVIMHADEVKAHLGEDDTGS